NEIHIIFLLSQFPEMIQMFNNLFCMLLLFKMTDRFQMSLQVSDNLLIFNSSGLLQFCYDVKDIIYFFDIILSFTRGKLAFLCSIINRFLFGIICFLGTHIT